MKNVDISVIMPCYNVEKYIDRSIKSICDQSIKNIEIICVDDGSGDSTCSKISELVQKDSRITLFRFEHNQGQSSARNLGLKIARGKYVYFMDSDDELEEKAFEKLFSIAEHNNSDVVLFEAKAIKRNNVIYTIDRPVVNEESVSGNKAFRIFYDNFGLDNYCVWVQFWRREYLKDMNILFYEGIFHEDILFSFRAILNAGRVSVINENLYRYYINEDTTTNQRVSWKHIQSLIIVLDEIIKDIMGIIGDKGDCDEVLAKYLVNVYNHYKEKLIQANLQLEECSLWEKESKRKYLYNILKEIQKTETNYQQCVSISTPDQNKIFFEKEDTEKILNCNRVIVYGAGKIARRVIIVLNDLGIENINIVVSDIDKSVKRIFGYEVREFATEQYDSKTIFIPAVGKGLLGEVVDSIRNGGYNNICFYKRK